MNFDIGKLIDGSYQLFHHEESWSKNGQFTPHDNTQGCRVSAKIYEKKINFVGLKSESNSNYMDRSSEGNDRRSDVMALLTGMSSQNRK